MRRQSMSNTEDIVAQGLRPPCPGEPMGTPRTFMPIEDTRYVSPRASSNGVGNETFRGANIELCNHKGMLAK